MHIFKGLLFLALYSGLSTIMAGSEAFLLVIPLELSGCNGFLFLPKIRHRYPLVIFYTVLLINRGSIFLFESAVRLVCDFGGPSGWVEIVLVIAPFTFRCVSSFLGTGCLAYYKIHLLSTLTLKGALRFDVDD